MNSGRYIISQILDLVHWQTLSRLVDRYDAESRVRHFGCRQQLICMAFAQLTWREGLRDIADCLNARPHARYHLGFREPIAKSTLADANEQRDWRLWEDLAKSLIAKARPLYGGEDIGLDIENTVYALDSTTVDLSLTLFPWADFRRTKAGIKMHTQIDLRGPIPTCIFITSALLCDLRPRPRSSTSIFPSALPEKSTTTAPSSSTESPSRSLPPPENTSPSSSILTPNSGSSRTNPTAFGPPFSATSPSNLPVHFCSVSLFRF